MSFSATPSGLALATVSVTLLARVSPSDVTSCSSQCDQLSYCDDFENKCKPCSDVCSGPVESECLSSCGQYLHLHNIHHLHRAQELQPSQLHVLTIMVTLTAVMTSVVMVLLMVLMRMKMKKKKRLSKKINPSVLFTVDRDEIGQNQTNMESLSVNELGKKEKQSRDINRSISTMVTQISNDSSVPSEKFTSGSMRNTRNSFNSRTKRIPSEDCVPNFGIFNPGLDPKSEMSARAQDSHPQRQHCEMV